MKMLRKTWSNSFQACVLFAVVLDFFCSSHAWADIIPVENRGTKMVIADGRLALAPLHADGMSVEIIGRYGFYWIGNHAFKVDFLSATVRPAVSTTPNVGLVRLLPVFGRPGHYYLSPAKGRYVVAQNDKVVLTTQKAGSEWFLPGFVSTTPTNWMHSIRDNIQLSDLSIPGTHDSGADYGCKVGSRWAKTQDKSIAEQLAHGVRYLDIRTRPVPGGFAIHHGPCYQHKNFRRVVSQVHRFLRENPSETVIMRIKRENVDLPDGVKSADWRAAFRRIREEYPGIWYEPNGTSGVPTLANVRGQIVVYQQSIVNDPYINFGFGWSSVLTESSQEADYLSIAYEDKKARLRRQLHGTKNLVGSGKMNLISSGGNSKGLILGGPVDYAAVINPWLTKEMLTRRGHRPFGIIATDFPSDELLAAIIDSNPRTAPPDIRFLEASYIRAKSRTNQIRSRNGRNETGEALCMDLRSEQVGATVVVAPCGPNHSRPYQRWWWRYGSLVNTALGLCFDLRSTEIGSPVVLSTCRPSDVRRKTQYQSFTTSRSDHKIRNVKSRKCLDLRRYENGAAVIIAECRPDGWASQEWDFVTP